ncbi:hypothetical protein D3C72_1581440 [compost metagenome]
MGDGLAAGIDHLTAQGQPHVHHGIRVGGDGQLAGGLLIIAGRAAGGAIEAPFT